MKQSRCCLTDVEEVDGRSICTKCHRECRTIVIITRSMEIEELIEWADEQYNNYINSFTEQS